MVLDAGIPGRTSTPHRGPSRQGLIAVFPEVPEALERDGE